MLITPEYAALNKQLHRDTPGYGCSGRRYANLVAEAESAVDGGSVLDYGCGKRTLAAYLPWLTITQYDPCTDDPDVEHNPRNLRPHDIVVCTDVLEHIEPENLADVIIHLNYLTKKKLIVAIHTGPAKKTLADGRNAHLNQYPAEWWICSLSALFDLETFMRDGARGCVMALTPKPGTFSDGDIAEIEGIFTPCTPDDQTPGRSSNR